MSGKRAKEGRRQKPVATVVIIVNNDGSVQVSGFPTNLIAAMNIMNAGMTRVAEHFARMAQQGKVDDNLTLEQSRIIQPDNGIKTIH